MEKNEEIKTEATFFFEFHSLKGAMVACFMSIPPARVVIFDIFFHFGS